MGDSTRQREEWVSTRVAHLQMLQGLVDRMSVASGQIKVANTGIVTAVVSVSVSLANPHVAVVAGPVVLLLSALDAYYLSLERGFRETFDELRASAISGLADFEMRPKTAPSFWHAFASPSVWPFHLGLLAIVSMAVFFVTPNQSG